MGDVGVSIALTGDILSRLRPWIDDENDGVLVMNSRTAVAGRERRLS
jgi:hypothetical protein